MSHWNSAHWAPGSSASRLIAVVLSFLIAGGAGAVTLDGASVSASTGPKVVIVVGPAGWKTAANRISANAAAREALRHTPNVVKIYSPNATWARVKAALTGASVVVYLGSGYGSPTRSGSMLRPAIQDGFGLNAVVGGDNVYTKWYGEASIRTVRLAPKAVVLLARMSYASGSSEPGMAAPSLTIARRRVDNYGAGFLAAGASAVIADSLSQPAYYIRALFTRQVSLDTIWHEAPSYHAHATRFVSARTAGAIGRTDPDRPGSGFNRSIIGWPSTNASAVLEGNSTSVTPPPPGGSGPAPTVTASGEAGRSPAAGSACGSSLQARLDGSPTASVVDLSGCSYSAGATVNRSMTIRGAEIHPARGTAGLTVAADGVTLDRLTIVGAQAASYVGGDYGVFVAASAGHPVSRLTISNSTVGNFGNGGIWLQYATGPVIQGNLVHDVVYAGIMIISGTGGRIGDNQVERIGISGSDAHGGNAYGIVLTDTGGSPTTDFTVVGNTVTDVPTWHALDTHGGHQITFEGNTVYRSSRGLFITTSASGSRPDTIVATGNLLASPSTASGRPQAVTTFESNNVSITRNTASGWGVDGFFGDYLGRSTNLTVLDNAVTP